MLSAVYTYKNSAWRNLTHRLKGVDTLSSAYTFYAGEVKVAGLYNYVLSPSSRIEVDGEHLLLKRQNRVILFTQYYTLERDGRTLATAKETKSFQSRSQISYEVDGHSRELTLRVNVWKLRGRQYLLLDGQERVGVIEFNSDFGADIDLPRVIPLAVQIFIFKVASIMWQRGGPNG
jgi:hypothetical protein